MGRLRRGGRSGQPLPHARLPAGAGDHRLRGACIVDIELYPDLLRLHADRQLRSQRLILPGLGQ